MGWTLDDLRSDIPVLRRKVYLNTGTLGASPQTVTVAFVRAYEQWQVEGPGWPEAYEARRAGMDAVRARVGLFLGAASDRIAFAENISQAINWVAGGLRFSDGDEVIVGTHEHPANRYPWRALERMGRVRVVLWEMDGDDDALMEDLSRLITPHTRLVTVSHVLQTNGRVLPAERIAQFCRSAGVRLFLDGAQAVGQLRVDLSAIDPDFYGWNGHKWLLGPVGTAGLYARPDAFGELGLLPAGGGSAEHDLAGRYEDDVPWRETPRRLEVGTRNWPLYEGLARAIDLFGEIGWGQAFAASASLVEQFLAGLPPGVEEIAVPRRAAMVTVRVGDLPAKQALEDLYRHGQVIVRAVEELQPQGAVRFSFAPFNTPKDVERALEALGEVVRRV
ncbi:MAG: aminotransferase class V-fold PLP-dependent enzyme [Thermaerobacter sp.]|nr:aminotransferase class V-fold PLP-dependent enzyme [Thermaerobacter sp.]